MHCCISPPRKVCFQIAVCIHSDCMLVAMMIMTSDEEGHVRLWSLQRSVSPVDVSCFESWAVGSPDESQLHADGSKVIAYFAVFTISAIALASLSQLSCCSCTHLSQP